MGAGMGKRAQQLRPNELDDSAGGRTTARGEDLVAPSRADASASGIRIKGLSKTYERITATEIIRTHALKELSVDVRPQEFVSLIGPSGCGKTTVLKIIAGLLSPSAGEVYVAGRLVRAPGTDRATVFQYPGLMPWRSVMDNVVLALEFADVPKAQRRARATQYVDLVGLQEFHDHYPAELSGGMQQRVGLARALSIEPQVLLMDEPFGALDAITRAQMQTELLNIWEHMKTTVVFVTHSIDEAILLSDRILVMKDGGIVAEEEVRISRPRTREGLVEDPVAIALRRELVELL
jgi:ABC-type nitrate/sulfonate/bicarbonate transport system ATPase subunit